MTDLIGRTTELESVDRWLASGGRLLTIAGPPGVGKSRLAHELVARQAGSVICDLTACRTADDVERAVQQALGGVSRARLARVLAAFEGTVVLDRFEHLVESARGLVDTWTARPGPRFVIASREPLGLLRESVIALGPLAEADAVELYRVRARRTVDAGLASSIVKKVDLLPLAIELAAARASVLSEREVLARLEAGILDSPSSSLRATITWSIDLLSPEERTTLLHCAVFRGPFDGRAAEAVVRTEVEDPRSAGDTIACLVALERKSLAHRAATASTDSRVVLYDAVREVALEALSLECDLDDVAARHAHHFRELAAAVLDGSDATTARALAREVADLAAALAFFHDRDPAAAAKLAIAIDLAHVGQAPSNAHLELLSTAVRCAARAGDRVLSAKALQARARAHRLRGAAHRAARDLRAALALARGAGSPIVEADVLRLLGVVARQLSRPLRARTLLRRALELYEGAGASGGAAVVLDDLGVVAHDLGELTVARDSYERALALERVVGDRRFEGITLGHLGLIAHELGDVEGAEAFYREALAKHRDSDDRRFEGFAHAFLATAMVERFDLEGAERSLEAAAAIDARLGDVDSGVLLAGIGCAVAAASGRIALGREILVRAQLELAGRDDEALQRTLTTFAAALRIAEARRARAEGRSDDERAHLDAVREALAPGQCPRSIEERLAQRVVARLMEREVGSPAVVVGADGTWFENDGRRVSLRTRRALALMLAKLAKERRDAPGQSVGMEALFEAGWPGERVPEASAKRRVYVGIDTLRSAGLRSAIAQRDRGYLLDPAVEVRDGPGLNEV